MLGVPSTHRALRPRQKPTQETWDRQCNNISRKKRLEKIQTYRERVKGNQTLDVRERRVSAVSKKKSDFEAIRCDAFGEASPTQLPQSTGI